MTTIPPPVEMIEAYFQVVQICRIVEDIPEEIFGEMFDTEIEDAINSLSNAISSLSWIPEAINDCREAPR